MDFFQQNIKRTDKYHPFFKKISRKSWKSYSKFSPGTKIDDSDVAIVVFPGAMLAVTDKSC